MGSFPKLTIVLLSGFFLTFLNPVSSPGEFYIAGMGGAVFPQELSNVTVDFVGEPRSINNSPLKTGAMGGGKIGYFLPAYPWLGIETEGYFTSLQFEGQPFASVPPVELQVTTWAFNAIVRYPGKRFQPYMGAGLGLFFADQTALNGGSGTIADNWVQGFNALAGIRTYLTESQAVALFGEYKFNHAEFEFQEIGSVFAVPRRTLQETYTAHIIALGLSVHFNITPLGSE